MARRRPTKHWLPRESAAVFTRGYKQTTDIAAAVCFALGLKEVLASTLRPPPSFRGVEGSQGGGWVGHSKPLMPSHEMRWIWPRKEGTSIPPMTSQAVLWFL